MIKMELAKNTGEDQLNKWEFKQAGTNEWLDAHVPGSVYTDLLRLGFMEDPFYKDNEDKICAILENDFIYKSYFLVNDDFMKADKQILRFDGIDTIADIYLNDVLIGNAINMHRIWEYDVTSKLKKGKNELKIYLHSPLTYIKEAYEKCPTQGNEDTFEGFMHLRKAHCMFGWDWGAHLPDAGIFRRVTLLGITKARLDEVYIKQFHEKNRVRLEIETQLLDNCRDSITNYDIKIDIIDPKGNIIIESSDQYSFIIENPLLWWPNGLGDQNLYQVKISLFDTDELLDDKEYTIGLRTLTMHIKPDEWGESFAHEINGIPIFAMGADYIPEDHLLGRITRDTTKQLLEKCVFANFNTIRVWGGGYYPEDWFYELCDKLGLIVWQDFMFACSMYELTKDFEENITQEFIDNIKRLRNHASLGLWCGNNEMELFAGANHHWVTKASEKRDYILMYERIIPEIVSKYGNQTFYWPASPSSGGSFDEPNDPNRGDVHYWEVWHGNKPFSEYRKYFFRYASEFGFQSFPTKKTIEMISDDERDHNIFSYVLEKHQRNFGANGKIMNYLQQTYLYPSDFSVLLYASQLLQADAIRYGVEHFRRNRGRCMGAIYWQLNDCWPVASWSSIDYAGRLKALHYYAKRFFAPLMISCQEEGMMTSGKDMNRQHFTFEKSITLNVANETHFKKDLEVRWALRNSKAQVLEDGSQNITVKPFSATWLEKVTFPNADLFCNYVSYELLEDGKVVSEGTVNFSFPKYFHYENPKLSYRIEGNEIIIKSDVYAKSIELTNEEENLIISDNYFDLNGNEKRVTVISGDINKLKLRSVYDIR